MSKEPAVWTAATVLALALQGCASYRPDPLIPSAELAALTRRGLDALPEAGACSAPAEWFPLEAQVDLADGLSLGEANALGLFFAPRVRAARSEADLSAGQLLQAGLLRNPELAVGPRFTTGPTDLILPAALLLDVPLGGRRSAELDKAGSELQAARLDVMAVELEMLIDVRSRFLHVRALAEERRLLAVVAEQSDEAYRWASRLEEADEASPLAAALARLDRDEARQDLRGKEAEHAEARAGLLEAIGLLATAPVRIVVEGSFALPHLPDIDRVRALGHPRLRKLEASYQAAEHALRVEVARQYPELRVGPDYEYAQGESSLGLGLLIELPLFDRNRGGIASAESERNAARERYQSELLRLARDESAARAAHEAARDLLEEYRTGTLEAVERAEEGVAARLRGGQSDLLELLEARRAVARARLRAVALEERVLVAALEAAYAGGWVLPRVPEGGKP